MIVVMKKGIEDDAINEVVSRLRLNNQIVHVATLDGKAVIIANGTA